MAEGFINLTEGSGKKAHTWNRTIGANSVEDEFTLPGEFPLASYFILLNNVSAATSNDHIIQIMAGSSLKVRIRAIHLSQGSNATTAGTCTYEVYRLTTAGTGGTSVTPAKFDTADAAAGCTGMTLPSSKGTESTLLMRVTRVFRSTTTVDGPNSGWDWEPQPNSESLVIAAGTTNGIAIKVPTGIAGATVNGWVEVVETSF